MYTLIYNEKLQVETAAGSVSANFKNFKCAWPLPRSSISKNLSYRYNCMCANNMYTGLFFTPLFIIAKKGNFFNND